LGSDSGTKSAAGATPRAGRSSEPRRSSHGTPPRTTHPPLHCRARKCCRRIHLRPPGTSCRCYVRSLAPDVNSPGSATTRQEFYHRPFLCVCKMIVSRAAGHVREGPPGWEIEQSHACLQNSHMRVSRSYPCLLVCSKLDSKASGASQKVTFASRCIVRSVKRCGLGYVEEGEFFLRLVLTNRGFGAQIREMRGSVSMFPAASQKSEITFVNQLSILFHKSVIRFFRRGREDHPKTSTRANLERLGQTRVRKGAGAIGFCPE
jgi:hypothetical protein